MTSLGESATVIGSAAGLEMRDWVYSQYREMGVLFYRGYPVEKMLN